jgi:hypothetical protein
VKILPPSLFRLRILAGILWLALTAEHSIAQTRLRPRLRRERAGAAADDIQYRNVGLRSIWPCAGNAGGKCLQSIDHFAESKKRPGFRIFASL